MSEKRTAEIAAEITIAALGTNTAATSYPDMVVKFYRAIYKEIATCEGVPLEDLR